MKIFKNVNDHRSMFTTRMMTGKYFKMQKNDFDQQMASKAPIAIQNTQKPLIYIHIWQS